VKAGERAKQTGFVIAGFVIGCGLGAGCQAVTGLWSLALAAGLALVALAIAVAAKLDGSQTHPPHPCLVQDRWEAVDPKETVGAGSLVSTDYRRHEADMNSTSATKAG
jgi:hypothetical protein